MLFHSVVWQYLPEDTKAAIAQAMDDAGANAAPDRPLAWLRMEGLGGSDPFATLPEVDGTVTPHGPHTEVPEISLTDEEKRQLVAFLKAL